MSRSDAKIPPPTQETDAKKKGPRNVAVPEAPLWCSDFREPLPRITVKCLVRDGRRFGEQIFFA
jgi:hypothetical protein